MAQKSLIMENKKANKARIAKFIYIKKETSKQEISQVLGLSMPTVLQNVKALIESGLVKEVGEYQSTGGRKAKALSIDGDYIYSIGLDITRHHISLVLVDAKGQLKFKERLRKDYENTMDYYASLGRSIEQFIQANTINEERILGVGISIPGIIDEKLSVLVRSHILEVTNISLKNFSQFIKFDTCFRNDANSAAYAELHIREGNEIYLSLSNTVGGAISMNGQIYMGDYYKSAEFGHMIIQMNGESCYCGKKGCVDAYCSARVLAQHADDDIEVFFKELEIGNLSYKQVWSIYLDYLAVVITNLRMTFDCDIVLGGYVGGYLNHYMVELQQSILKYNNFEMDTSYVKSGKYKLEASAIGAGLEFIETYFDYID